MRRPGIPDGREARGPNSIGFIGVPSGAGSLALLVLCLASFMAVVVDTIVTIALPSMRRDLGFSGADAQWIFNGYMLPFGGLLLLSGRAADASSKAAL